MSKNVEYPTLEPAEFYFILDLDTSCCRMLQYACNWWRANNSGYTHDVAQAGLYPRHKVEANLGYYHNGRETFAVPFTKVTGQTVSIVPTDSVYAMIGSHKVDKERGITLKRDGKTA